jgi:hypothetical protein
MKKIIFWLAAILAILIIIFLVKAAPIDPAACTPPEAPELPKALWPKPEPYGLVLELDEAGNIVRSLHDQTGEHLKEITSAREFGGYLYLGGLHNDRIGKYKLP